MSVQLLNPRTAQLVAGKPVTLAALDLLRLEHARFLQKVYGNTRQTIVDHWSKSTSLQPNYKNWALRYRAVIERGDWSGAPLIQGWSLRPFRMQSPISLYKATLQAMHPHPEKNQDWELDFQGLSADLRNVEQEQEKLSQSNPTIKMVLDQWQSQGFGRTSIDPNIEEFARIRNSKTPHLNTIGTRPFEEWAKYQDEGPEVKKTFAMIFPAGTAPEEMLRDMYTIYHGEPQLTAAVRANDEEEVRHLLENGAETEVVNDQGVMPLQMAVQFQYEEIVRLLLQYKANPDNYRVSFMARGEVHPIHCPTRRTGERRRGYCRVTPTAWSQSRRGSTSGRSSWR
ncbi:Ankyrin repeat-containing domain protein [Metarhizium guizhouense ARSEF 977]|uniref:Ankyrin repeat-containing domain protein n=1 Tax=Metarhizium guizhouense (strain ARSEF 977) TaxID=1276136 RepID=A0A0B4HSJ9_METGA|nr:Ankyrin repeat-containing domain protein [Metarhizium guizhouense ARSEF 977]